MPQYPIPAILQILPADVQRSAFRLFDCVGRGSLDFRNFCRALALCCRGSREERLRFLFDLFSAANQPKHYGTGTDGGVREAPGASGGAPAACLSEVSKLRASWDLLVPFLGFLLDTNYCTMRVTDCCSSSRQNTRYRSGPSFHVTHPQCDMTVLIVIM